MTEFNECYQQVLQSWGNAPKDVLHLLHDAHHADITAEREARQKAEAECAKFAEYNPSVKSYKIAAWQRDHWKHRAEAAEARIKASQEQEPALKRFNEFMEGESETPLERLRFFCSLAMKGQDWLDVEQFFNELQSELKEGTDLLSASMKENAELTRKLAELQAVIKYAVEISEAALDGKYDDHKADVHLHIVNKLKNSHSFELTKLLEEAKRHAVPEGMIILPTTCPECGTKDIEYACMCHNSKCKGYAMEFSVYEGWRAAPQPHKD